MTGPKMGRVTMRPTQTQQMGLRMSQEAGICRLLILLTRLVTAVFLVSQAMGISKT